MWNSVVVFFASVLTLVGLVLIPLPIPLGALFFATGLTLLVSRSNRAAVAVKHVRIRSRWLDQGLRLVENRSPHWIANVLSRTRP